MEPGWNMAAVRALYPEHRGPAPSMAGEPLPGWIARLPASPSARQKLPAWIEALPDEAPRAWQPGRFYAAADAGGTRGRWPDGRPVTMADRMAALERYAAVRAGWNGQHAPNGTGVMASMFGLPIFGAH